MLKMFYRNFEIELELNGMENLDFIPLGKFTEVNVNSPWNNPSFAGAFLPTTREITEDGFTAQWRVNHFNRSYPQEWEGKTYDAFPSAFGVKLLVPVDEYQKTMRTSKYGLMIIVLTFLSFFMIELFSKKVIHPIQYLLVRFSAVDFLFNSSGNIRIHFFPVFLFNFQFADNCSHRFLC